MKISQGRKDRIIEAVKALNFKWESNHVYLASTGDYFYPRDLPFFGLDVEWCYICSKEEFDEVAAELLAHQPYEPSILEECEYTLGESDVWYACKIIDDGKRGWTILCPHLASDCGKGLQFVLKDGVKFRPTKTVQNKLDILTKECSISPQQAKTILDKLENV